MNTRIAFWKSLPLLVAATAFGACGDNSKNNDVDSGAVKHDMAKPGDAASNNPDEGTNENPDLSGPINTNPETATLRIHYPKGTHSLSVRGDKGGLNWDSGQSATADGDSLFTFTVTLAAGETLEWKPLLDDKDWSHGPNYKAKRGETLDVYPHFYTAAGRLDKPNDLKAFKGDNLSSRDVWVWLPPSYDENSTAKYPVLYMHDATNLFDASTSFGGVEWKVDETLNGAIEGDGSIQEIIVVALFATGDRIPDYTPTVDSQYGGGNGDAYLKMIVEKLKPVIDSKYRTLTDRANTGMMGSSLGGLISTYAGVKYPDVFGLIGAMSPSTWWDDTYIIGSVGGIDMTKAHPIRVYMDSGNPDDGYADTKNLAAKWKSLGYQDGSDFEYVVQNGAQHNESYWQQRLPGALKFLFGPRTP